MQSILDIFLNIGGHIEDGLLRISKVKFDKLKAIRGMETILEYLVRAGVAIKDSIPSLPGRQSETAGTQGEEAAEGAAEDYAGPGARNPDASEYC